MKPEGINPLAFHFVWRLVMEYKDEIIDLRTIEAILKYKPEIENNPFQSMDKEALMEAFKVIEEFSEEIKPI
jgi:hypothetical protein